MESAFGVRSLALMGGLVRGYGRWWLVGEGLDCPIETPILSPTVAVSAQCTGTAQVLNAPSGSNYAPENDTPDPETTGPVSTGIVNNCSGRTFGADPQLFIKRASATPSEQDFSVFKAASILAQGEDDAEAGTAILAQLLLAVLTVSLCEAGFARF